MRNVNKQQGFTLMELVIAVAIIGILTTIALPSYLSSVVRSSREEAQTEILQLASIQEKIFLNSNSYSTATNIIAATYDGTATGGLGWSSGVSKDKKYTYSCNACTANSYTILATPTPGLGQAAANDGTLSVDQTGVRLWVKNGATTNW
ncbi:MAG: type IV pilin protein [Gallionella sp.]